MNKLIAVSALMVAAAPAFANPVPNGTVPEPGVLALMGAAAVAFFIARRMKK
ncbi:PEP-CTERM sorting domain-containing protein [Neptunomonas qingdaonensis]|uniref:PEP-CTERM protein-sorting domain-containing protein n=1 Tax=Neptunomonas qingdaonensis TaxID=1045558 RepID=A0A1I2UI31_9GAMM|nr:PEP-CTERM sorting domain-containing protein [Neptunomonas qingdaonensis]SFG75999.1 PEP-CTERM protein-sorting domain-containing protein [Neptunomonas qingdaonensis]